MRSIVPADDSTQMVRGEQQYRLRGAVTQLERSAKIGQYYTVKWINRGGAPAPLYIVMDYQQAASGAKKLQIQQSLDANEPCGDVEFRINGENYRRNGEVVSWRIRLMSGKRVIDEKRSYLWR